MAFPSNPTNGQSTVVNGITYQYSSATNSWYKSAGSGGNPASGTDTEVQFNDNGNSNGSSAFTFNKITQTVSIGGVEVSPTAVTIPAAASLNANGSIGTDGQVLASNGSTVYWTSAAPVDENAQYDWTNTHSFVANVTYTNTNILANTSNIYAKDGTFYGNVNVIGTLTTVNVATVAVSNSIIQLAANNTTDLVDIGTIGLFNDGTANSYTGVFRDASTKEYYVMGAYKGAVTSAGVDITDGSFALAPINVSKVQTNIVNVGNSSVNVSINATAVVLPTTGGISANGSLGVNGQVLTSNGTASYWTNTSPSVFGSNTEVYFNDSDTSNGSAGFTFDKVANNLAVANTISTSVFVAGNSTVSTTANATSVTTSLATVGNSTVNVSINATTVTLPNTGAISANGTVGTNGQILTSNGTASYWATSSAAATAGANTEVQFNDSGVANATSGFVFDKVANNLTVANTIIATGITVNGAITANGLVGSNGSVLTSNGTAAYWSTSAPVLAANGQTYNDVIYLAGYQSVTVPTTGQVQIILPNLVYSTPGGTQYVTYNGLTGAFTMKAGLTYRFTASLPTNSWTNAAGSARIFLVDATTKVPVSGSAQGTLYANNTSSQNQSPVIDIVYSPSSDQNVMFVANTSGPSCTFAFTYPGSSIVATRIGSDFALNTISNIDVANSLTVSGNLSVNGVITQYGSNVVSGTYQTDYIQTYCNTIISLTSQANTDLIFTGVQAQQNIPYNSANGVFTLSAGKTYKLKAAVYGANFSAGAGAGTPPFLDYNFVYASNNIPINTYMNTRAIPVTSTWADSAQQICEIIFTPSVTTGVKLRTTASTAGSSSFIPAGSGASYIIVEQLAQQFSITSNTWTLALANSISVNTNLTVGSPAGGNLYVNGAIFQNGVQVLSGSQTIDHLHAYATATQSVTGGSTITFDRIVNVRTTSTTYSAGVFRLAPGNVYKLTADVSTTTGTNGFAWYNETAGAYVDSAAASTGTTVVSILDNTNGGYVNVSLRNFSGSVTLNSTRWATVENLNSNFNISANNFLFNTLNVSNSVTVNTNLIVGSPAGGNLYVNGAIFMNGQNILTATYNTAHSRVQANNNVTYPSIPFNFILDEPAPTNNGIPYDAATGIWTLTAGATYEIEAMVCMLPGAQAVGAIALVDANTLVPINSTIAQQESINIFTANNPMKNPSQMYKTTYTPSTNQTVRLRFASASAGAMTTTTTATSVTVRGRQENNGNVSYCLIKQVGQSLILSQNTISNPNTLTVGTNLVVGNPAGGNLYVNGAIFQNGQPIMTGTFGQNITHAYLAAATYPGAVTAAPYDVKFDTTIAGATIPYSTATGFFTLEGGKTYELVADLYMVNQLSGADTPVIAWVDATTNAVLPGGAVQKLSSNRAYGDDPSSGLAKTIYTPSVNQTVKVRVISATTSTFVAGSGSSNRASYATVKQIAQTIAFSANAMAINAFSYSVPINANTLTAGTLTVNNTLTSNQTVLTGNTTLGPLVANSSLGVNNQVLISNGAGVAWGTPSVLIMTGSHSSTQNLTNALDSNLSLDTSAFTGLPSGVSNPFSVSGFSGAVNYLNTNTKTVQIMVVASLQINEIGTTATGLRGIKIKKNGTTIVGQQILPIGGSTVSGGAGTIVYGQGDAIPQAHAIFELAPGESFTCYGYQTNFASTTLVVPASGYKVQMTVLGYR